LPPAGLELVERRDQRLGDVAAAVVAVAHAISVPSGRRWSEEARITLGLTASGFAGNGCDERAHALGVLDPRSGLEARARVDRPGAGRGDRLPDVLRSQAACEHEAPFDRPCPLEMGGVLLLPRAVDDGGYALAVAEQHGVAAANSALLAVVELDEVGPGLRGLADEDRDRERRVRHRQDLSGSPRARALEDEATEVGARIDRHRDVFLAGEAADLDERPREDLAQLGGGVACPHQG